MLRERYGPIDVRARIADDPKIRAMLAELAEEFRVAAEASGARITEGSSP